jgi:hypothetical protein
VNLSLVLKLHHRVVADTADAVGIILQIEFYAFWHFKGLENNKGIKYAEPKHAELPKFDPTRAQMS